eukprot:CAMPEP_0178712700 /NCGR_PEP_ID=MMETSP0699-20121125/19026_1 /TAXON_ID=265572 /ORGANISM="Extubocellulus spinifer, Strain CCMP396" /LENGTH=763 /DNA_ID=CAMNT_0020361477 /DNA_START=2064 /DNA_END=4355 /DNA_ORIENTATION=+
MVRHYDHEDSGRRRRGVQDTNGDFRKERKSNYSSGRPPRAPRTPTTPTTPRREDRYDSYDAKDRDDRKMSYGRDPPPSNAEDYFVTDDPPRNAKAANELKNIGTESFTSYDASKFDNDSRLETKDHPRNHRSDDSSYMGDNHRPIENKHSEESDRLVVVSTMSHFTSPNYAKLRHLSSKNSRNVRGGGDGRKSTMPRPHGGGSYYDEDTAYTGYTDSTGYTGAYSRPEYSGVVSRDTGLTGQSTFTDYRYDSRESGLAYDYTGDDNSRYYSRYDDDSAYTDEISNPNTTHLLKEVKREMKELRRDFEQKKRDKHEDVDVQICDFSVIQKQVDKLVQKGKTNLEDMIASGKEDLVKRMNEALDQTKNKSPPGRGARRREKWDDHLKKLDPAEIAANESGLVSTSSFIPSPSVVVDFDGKDAATAVDAADANTTGAVGSIKPTVPGAMTGVSYDEPTFAEGEEEIHPVTELSARPPTPPRPHDEDGPDVALSPRHTTPDSKVMIRGGQMSVINPSVDELNENEYTRNAKAAFHTLGNGVASFFSTANVSVDESVEVEARGKNTIVDGTDVVKSLSPWDLPGDNDPPKESCNDTHTTTVTLIKPSPSTSSILKNEANISGPVYQGPTSGLPNEAQEFAASPPASFSPSAARHDEGSDADSSRRMKVIKSTNGLRKSKQATPRPKKTVTEWLAGTQFEKKPAGTKWVKSKSGQAAAKNGPSQRLHPKLPNGAGKVAVKSTRKNGLKADENASVEVSIEDRDSSVYFV